jgi:hypothetical protein
LYNGGPSMEEFPFYWKNGIPAWRLVRYMDRLGSLVPQILDYFLEPAYGQVCLSDQDAELSWPSPCNNQHVVSDEMSITVVVADDERRGQVEVEVYQGADGIPRIQGLLRIFDGTLHLMKPGLLIFAPTGDEVLLHEIHEGPHNVTIYCDDYPTSRLVVLIDGKS